MSLSKIRKVEHGVVMCCPTADRIPAAMPTVRALGLRCQHYGWPGITRTKEGDILVSATERIRHVDPFGREVISRSTDGGHTWSEPVVIFDSVTDDRDHAINTLLDGTVVSTWFSSMAWSEDSMIRPEWKPLRDRLTPDTLRALSRGWLRRSHDGGRTWEEQVYPTLVGLHAGPSVLSNGDLIYCGPYSEDGNTRLVATRSADGGRTWTIVGEIPCARVRYEKNGRLDPQLDENHALETKPGNILCVFRGGSGGIEVVGADGVPIVQHVYHESVGNWNIHMACSKDGGKTWTVPEDLGIYGFPSYLLRLKAGPILCVYSHRRPPYSIRAILSYDDGIMWDTRNILTLREFPFRTDMGYPVALEVNPGEVLCAYYSVPGPPQGQFWAGTPGYESMDMLESGILSVRIWLE